MGFHSASQAPKLCRYAQLRPLRPRTALHIWLLPARLSSDKRNWHAGTCKELRLPCNQHKVNKTSHALQPAPSFPSGLLKRSSSRRARNIGCCKKNSVYGLCWDWALSCSAQNQEVSFTKNNVAKSTKKLCYGSLRFHEFHG